VFHIIDRSEPTGDYFLVPKTLVVIVFAASCIGKIGFVSGWAK